jgi:indole-3-glycerol phosphate synthase
VSAPNLLDEIVARKRREVERRARHALPRGEPQPIACETDPVSALRRDRDGLPRIIAEIKFRSPSAGVIRAREPGAVQSIARGYVEAGAAAISVLADEPGFGGSPLDVRRAAEAVARPVLFKEFVLSPLQVRLARWVGASMVLLLVRVLSPSELGSLIQSVREAGMEPVVEAADDDELDRALRTSATIVGVNARDLRTFQVDRRGAGRLLARIPEDRVAVFMSGISSPADLSAVAGGRADAVLMGEALMRAPCPRDRLREMINSLCGAALS